MSIATEAPVAGLDSLVGSAFAAALADSDAWPAESTSPVAAAPPPRAPSIATAIPQAPSAAMSAPSSADLPRAPEVTPDDLSISDLADLLATPAHAAEGDKAAVERLGRAATRRDPVASLDPLPWGRDAVTYSTATVATGREAGIHWPDLVAFRLSDDFPAAPFDPVPAADARPARR